VALRQVSKKAFWSFFDRQTMSATRFFCIICGEILEAADKVSRRLAECPHCHHVVPVPSAASSAEIGPDFPTRIGAFPPGILALEVNFLCEHCESKLRIDARYEGMQVTCPHCTKVTGVPRWSQREEPAAESAPEIILSAEEIEFLSAVDGPRAPEATA
jgi:DNA-directed RNA polymerase subunit RPC12/RpoP